MKNFPSRALYQFFCITSPGAVTACHVRKRVLRRVATGNSSVWGFRIQRTLAAWKNNHAEQSFLADLQHWFNRMSRGTFCDTAPGSGQWWLVWTWTPMETGCLSTWTQQQIWETANSKIQGQCWRSITETKVPLRRGTGRNPNTRSSEDTRNLLETYRSELFLIIKV